MGREPLAVGAAAAQGWMATEWAKSFFSDTLPENYVSESEARNAAERYFGPDYEQYASGTDWTKVLPGQIPGLARGGIVDPTSGGTLARLAEAGRPELVAPLPSDFDLAETLRSIDRAGHGTSRPLEIKLQLDGRELARTLVRYQADEWFLAGVTSV